ncbi:MAG: TauD/TfdA family dioxygenase [Gammaproteobacteria bacterium]|jgi:alpha-ketoglutarate-dependent taurine dioxygenase
MSQTRNNRVLLAPPPGSPFRLDDAAAYMAWRDWKLEQRPYIDELLVPLENPFNLRDEEKKQIKALCRRCNAVIYKVSDSEQITNKALVHQLGMQLGLSHLDDNLRSDEDDITSLTVKEQAGTQYIPYTNRPLSWHTDGYYNTPQHQVRGFILHCAQPAAEGGENQLIDHELVYLRLRDQNPAYIAALMHPEAMTIPPNVAEGSEIRGASSGPVFSVDSLTGSLHMRYSARKRNIEWRDDALTREAADCITQVLDIDELTYIYRLKVGEGVVCNNILHKRNGFNDSQDEKRLMYRARYYDRIADTGLNRQV